VSRAKELRRIYAELPTIQCKGECWPFCSPIRRVTSPEEWQRMIQARGHLPEASHPDLCQFLDNGRCSVYRERPPICHFYGLVETMICPWGCEPSPRYLSMPEMHEFMYRIRTGASKAEAHRFVQGMLSELSTVTTTDTEALTAQALYAMNSWTRTELLALLKLYAEGRTEHMPKPTLEALRWVASDATSTKR